MQAMTNVAITPVILHSAPLTKVTTTWADVWLKSTEVIAQTQKTRGAFEEWMKPAKMTDVSNSWAKISNSGWAFPEGFRNQTQNNAMKARLS